MEVTIAGFADLANVDAGGKLNMIGHFSEIGVPQFPFVMTMMAFVLALRGGSETHGRTYRLEIRMVDMDGQPMPFQLREEFYVMRPPQPYIPSLQHLVFNLRDMSFHRPGLYGVYVLVDGEVKRFEPLNVALRPLANPESGLGPESPSFTS